MTRSVLVTGAGGFIGQSLVPRLAASGWKVRAASRRPSHAFPAGVDSVELPDLAVAPTEALTADFRRLTEGTSHVVHLAGIAHQTKTIPEAAYMAVNAAACGALAAAARSTGVHRVVLMSSIRAQHGPVSTHPVRECEPAAPSDAYGRSKLAGEIALAEALAGSPVEHVILRPVVIYGPHAKGNMATLARLARSPIPAPFAGLQARRSVLAMGNLLDAVEHALVSPRLTGATCIVADPDALTLAEMIAALRAGLGRRADTLPLDATILHGLARLLGRAEIVDRLTGGLSVDVGRLLASGWSPRYGAEVGLYRWMRGE